MDSIHLENKNLHLHGCNNESSCDVDDHEKGWCDHSDDGNVGDVRETDPSEWNDILEADNEPHLTKPLMMHGKLLGTKFPLFRKALGEN
jgi:hypothetical protein